MQKHTQCTGGTGIHQLSTQKSFVGTALTGVNTPAQADENCSAFEWQLNNEEIALIDSEIDRLNIG